MSSYNVCCWYMPSSIPRAVCNMIAIRSLNLCVSEEPGGLNLIYVAGKGDWKWKREWLQECRHYSKAAKTSSGEGLICRRCLAGPAGKPWLDVQQERFNNAADLHEAAQSSS